LLIILVPAATALTGVASLVERLHEKQPVVIKQDAILIRMTTSRWLEIRIGLF
jgi:hypothetical protein